MSDVSCSSRGLRECPGSSPRMSAVNQNGGGPDADTGTGAEESLHRTSPIPKFASDAANFHRGSVRSFWVGTERDWEAGGGIRRSFTALVFQDKEEIAGEVRDSKAELYVLFAFEHFSAALKRR